MEQIASGEYNYVLVTSFYQVIVAAALLASSTFMALRQAGL
jgi:hypothetical protein